MIHFIFNKNKLYNLCNSVFQIQYHEYELALNNARYIGIIVYANNQDYTIEVPHSRSDLCSYLAIAIELYKIHCFCNNIQLRPIGKFHPNQSINLDLEECYIKYYTNTEQNTTYIPTLHGQYYTIETNLKLLEQFKLTCKNFSKVIDLLGITLTETQDATIIKINLPYYTPIINDSLFIIEEIDRFSNLLYKIMPNSHSNLYLSENSRFDRISLVRHILTINQFQEIKSFPFTLSNRDKYPVTLLDKTFLRSNLKQTSMRACKSDYPRFFEIAKVYHKIESKILEYTRVLIAIDTKTYTNTDRNLISNLLPTFNELIEINKSQTILKNNNTMEEINIELINREKLRREFERSISDYIIFEFNLPEHYQQSSIGISHVHVNQDLSNIRNLYKQDKFKVLDVFTTQNNELKITIASVRN